MKWCLLMMSVVFLSGCFLKTRVIELERSDQAHKGNAGYLLGQVPASEMSKHPKKRRILELDMTDIFEE